MVFIRKVFSLVDCTKVLLLTVPRIKASNHGMGICHFPLFSASQYVSSYTDQSVVNTYVQSLNTSKTKRSENGWIRNTMKTLKMLSD